MEHILKEKTITAINIKKPPLYKVVFFNDDKTPFDFVELILMNIFNKSKLESQHIALKVHKEGKAIVAIYPKEVAKTKKHLVDQNSLNNGYPLQCEIEVCDE